MAAFIGLAVGLILAGLLIAYLAPLAIKGVGGTVFRYIGIVLAVAGAVLLLAGPINWAAAQLKSMLGV